MFGALGDGTTTGADLPKLLEVGNLDSGDIILNLEFLNLEFLIGR